jgi:hypothetical protein
MSSCGFIWLAVSVTVLDRPDLERRSCECYAVSKREFDRLLGRGAARRPAVTAESGIGGAPDAHR